ncbi:Acetyltransferase (GNAT) family protein [Enhydrobacter aerosaccus]|uniref:Acetyltransferase (GNAT) family protein n=1 Tax=Enhydrobacter aerosaccus TaxID=225324 RepID=A0A1T4TJ87_9HYPH|nr:GNAT family N-acetyltransferase [Enhydrobacter aerosaccus]SKA40517.1 Acetyltransferase (GNAT) family protein [Enhydrobacter aerosaccus]
MSFSIRDIILPEERGTALSFIDGTQRYEYAIEPDRRLDDAVASEHLAQLVERVAINGGRIFIAEQNSRPVGWAVFLIEQHPLFVAEDCRTFGYIADLFVEEQARSLGIGRALIDRCEAEARHLGLRQLMIGVLANNVRAADIYARAGYAPYSLELRKFL